MADVDIKKASSQVSESERQALQQHGRTHLSGSRGWDPFFAFTPAEFFSGSPFALMRRMSEEMDRAFGQFGGHFAGQNAWYRQSKSLSRTVR
jgi:hypothetical protein